MLKSELIAKLQEHEFDCEVVVTDTDTCRDPEIQEVSWAHDLAYFEIRVEVDKDEARDAGYDEGYEAGLEEGKEAD